MIISQTPFRISFFGGGSDFPEFFRQYGGAVLAGSIAQSCYVTVRELPPYLPYRQEYIYSSIERVQRREEINHPLIRNAVTWLGEDRLRIVYDADLPARSGLGTSSAFAVGMLNAVNLLRGRQKSAAELADDAIYLERTLCGEAGGWQDQILAAYGGLRLIRFLRDGSYRAEPVSLRPDVRQALEERLFLVFTGSFRVSADIQQTFRKNLGANTDALLQAKDMAEQGRGLLEEARLHEFGQLLHRQWELKQAYSHQISSPRIREIYQRAIAAGAVGGKLLGAGGGGFFLLYAEPERRSAVAQALAPLNAVPVRFSEAGSRIIKGT